MSLTLLGILGCFVLLILLGGAVTTVFQITQRGMTIDEQIYYEKVMDRIHRKLYEAGLRDTLS